MKFLTSPNSWTGGDNMETVTIRNSRTSRGYITLSSWNEEGGYIYTLGQIYLGSNPNSKLEIVSLLNFFNSGNLELFYDDRFCYQRYNPKLYLSAFQTVATNWNYEIQNGQKNDLGNLLGKAEKSGSWPQNSNYIFLLIINPFTTSNHYN